jgi:hypothetical protein
MINHLNLGDVRGGACHPDSFAGRTARCLKRSGGATLKEIMKITGWQPHCVRGFLPSLSQENGSQGGIGQE